MILGLSEWPDFGRIDRLLHDEALRAILRKVRHRQVADDERVFRAIRESVRRVELIRTSDSKPRPSASQIRRVLNKLAGEMRSARHLLEGLDESTSKMFLVGLGIALSRSGGSADRIDLAVSTVVEQLRQLETACETAAGLLPARETTQRHLEPHRRYAVALAASLAEAYWLAFNRRIAVTIDSGVTGAGPFADFFLLVWEALEGPGKADFDVRRVVDDARRGLASGALGFGDCGS